MLLLGRTSALLRPPLTSSVGIQVVASSHPAGQKAFSSSSKRPRVLPARHTYSTSATSMNATELSHTSTFSGLKLAAKAWGKENAPRRVLAIHGWMDNAATWDHLAPLIISASSDVRLVAIDLAGHGKSEHRPGKGPYNFLDYIPDMLSLVESMNWDKFSLMGHSLGAALASTMAGLFSPRIESLVLVEGLGPWIDPKRPNFVDAFNKALTTNKLVHSRENPIYPHLEAAVSRWCETQPQMKGDSVAKLVARSTKQVEGGVVFTQDRSLRCSSFLRMTEEDVRECLERISCPVLVVLGDQGFNFTNVNPWFPVLYSQRKKIVEKHMSELIVPGGHHPHLDNPEPAVAAITAVLTGQPLPTKQL